MRRLTSLIGPLFIAAMLVTGCDRQQQDWEEAQETDTVAAYQDYLEKYPEGEFADSANDRIAAIQEQQAWDQARNMDSIEAYEGFVSQYPESANTDTAQERIRDLKRERNWFQLRNSTDIDALEEFIARHTGTGEAREALARVQMLTARAREEAEAEARTRAEAEEKAREAEGLNGEYRVQLAAYRSREQAEAGKQQIEDRFGNLLEGLAIEIESPAAGSSFHRLRTAALDADRARSLCASFKEQGQDCLVLRE